jgi:hypothetical protein
MKTRTVIIGLVASAGIYSLADYFTDPARGRDQVAANDWRNQLRSLGQCDRLVPLYSPATGQSGLAKGPSCEEN